MQKRFLLVLAGILAVFLLSTGCGNNNAPATNDTQETQEEKTDASESQDQASSSTESSVENQSGLVYRMTGAKINTLNPHIALTSSEGDTIDNTVGGMLALTYSKEKDTFDFTPNLAESLPERSEDGKTWTWHIRKDLKWPDGTPINAHDFEYSWKMLLDPKLKNGRAAEAMFSGAVSVVNAKSYWIGSNEDNIKLNKQKEESEALKKLKEEIEKLPDGEEKTKKQEEYDNRKSALQSNYIEISDEDLKTGGATWDQVGIKCLDDYTIQLQLEYPIPEISFWMDFTSGVGTGLVRKDLYEKGMSADRTETDYGSSIEKADYSGPYLLTKWERDSLREYAKNPNSPIKDIYTPESITERVVEDAGTAVQLFENNQIDVVGLSGAYIDKYGEDPRVVYQKSDSVVQMFINMTSEKPGKEFLRDINFRKALYWGTNRESIAKNIIKNAIPQPCVVADTRCIDPMTGETFRDTKQGKENYPENDGYDTEKAKEFFEKAYEKFGKKIVVEFMYHDTSERIKTIAEFLKEEYENLFGKDKFELQLRAVPPNNVNQRLASADYDLGLGAWSGGLFDPWNGMEPYTSTFGFKCDQYKSKEFDDLFVRANKGDLIFKKEEKIDALRDMEKMLLDAVPFVPLYQTEKAKIYSDRVHLLPTEWKIGVDYAPLQAELDPLQ